MTFAHGQALVSALLDSPAWTDTADVDRLLREACDQGLIHRVGTRPEFSQIERFAGVGGQSYSDLLRSEQTQHYPHLWGYSSGPDPNPPKNPSSSISYEPCVSSASYVATHLPWLHVPHLWAGVEIERPYPIAAPEGELTYYDAIVMLPGRSRAVWYVDVDSGEALELLTLRDLRDRLPKYRNRRIAAVDLDTRDSGEPLEKYLIV